MGLQIVGGDALYPAKVTAEGELIVRAITELEIEHAAINGNAFAWDSTELDIDAGDTMLFIKNLGDTPLIFDRAVFNGSNVICTWTVLIGSLTTVPAGTTVVGVNTNRITASTTANVMALSDETALADGDIVDRIKTAVSGHHVHVMSGIILGKDHYLQINQITESTSGSVIVHGHFENPS